MFVGKALIMVSSGFIAYVILMNASIKEQIYSPIVPVVIVVILSYIVGSIFLSVFSFSATAILHAFLLNEEIGGSIHPPQSLEEFIRNNDKQYDKEKYKKGGDAKKEGDGPVDGKDDKQPNNIAWYGAAAWT